MLSHWVGQPGPWLTKVKFVLGLPILYVAYTYYLKSMDIAGVPEPVAHAMLLGVVAIGLAVFIGDFYRLGANSSHSARVRGALGIVLLIVGIYFLYNGLGRSGILIPAAVSRQDGTSVADTVPLRASSSAGVIPPQGEIRGNLRWFRDFALAQEHARREHKPLFVDFYATWCANCKAFDHLTRRNARLNTALQQVVLVKIYDTDVWLSHVPARSALPGIRRRRRTAFFAPVCHLYSARRVGMEGTELRSRGDNGHATRTGKTPGNTLRSPTDLP